jgi:hypothetical protein
MNDFELFCKKLKELFGDPNERATAERNLYALKQKGSATSYLADFQRYSVLVEWNDQAKMAQFYRGLKEMVKDELAKQDDSQTLTELMERAVKIDTRLYERNLEKARTTASPMATLLQGTTPTTRVTTVANPMESQTATSPTLQQMVDSQRRNTNEGGTTSSAFTVDRQTTPSPTALKTSPSSNPTPHLLPSPPSRRIREKHRHSAR